MTGFLVTPSGQFIEGIHDPSRCAGRFCVVHNPSDHHMKGWQLYWRDDRHIFERICPHGVGHPDPDGLAFLKQIGHPDADGIHGCDGCCSDA